MSFQRALEIIRISLTDPTGGVFRYVYDKAGRMISIANPVGAAVQFTRDADGRVAGMGMSNTTGAAMAYDAAGHSTALAWSSPGAALPQFGLAYDPAGNPTSITDATGAHLYQYDALNRLTAATHPAQTAETYSYDGAGNRTGSAADPSYAYDVSERLTSGEGAAYTWDANGNLIQRQDSHGVTTYTYDLENHLVAIAFPDGTAVFLRRQQRAA